MRRLLSTGAYVIALGFSLAGCGGGSKPAPLPTPPPIPTSTFPLSSSATFESITATRTEQTGGAPNLITVARLGVQGRSAAVTFNYDAAGNTYRITSADAAATFDRSAGTPSGDFTKYVLQSDQIADELNLFRNVQNATSGGIQLSYLSFGNWSHSNSGTGKRDLTYFLFGTPTALTDMPRTGSATYNSVVSGNIRDIKPTVDGITEFGVGGTATFTANFGSGTVATGLTLARSDNVSLGSYSGTGTISENQFTGMFSSTNPYFDSGSFAGGFFGPGAGEMGYAFTIRNHNPDPFAGAAVNYVDQWIAGAVVGVKTGP